MRWFNGLVPVLSHLLIYCLLIKQSLTSPLAFCHPSHLQTSHNRITRLLKNQRCRSQADTIKRRSYIQIRMSAHLEQERKEAESQVSTRETQKIPFGAFH